MRCFNPVETLEGDRLDELKLERLRSTVDRLYERVPFYRDKLDAVEYRPGDIKSLKDLESLPFTTKDDLRDNYPFGLFAVPMRDIVRIHASSGTTGKSTVVGYTAGDIQVWADLVARTIVAAGGDRDDVVHVSYGYGLFTGGLGLHYGAEKLGATALPMSGGNTKRQIMILQDFGPTAICCTPSYALNIAEVAEAEGVDVKKLKLKGGCFGAEPWTNEMRANIERRLGISAVDIYGLTEVIGPGVSSECQEKNGLHIFDDHFYPEILDPVTLEPVPEGEKGELVFTSLTKEAFPVIRYRTRDISRLTYEPCKCGRTHVRMERVTGRTDDMLIIRGVNVFPTQIESVLLVIEETEPHYHIHVYREGNLDNLEVWVELSEKFFSDEIKGLESLSKRIAHEIQGVIGVACKVKLVEPKTIERSEGKAKRVTDHRKL